ncbi:MAG: hypothetical protein IT354_14410, partial [Gemmatimonadaceae bacterium]|nr:hypothetical protein [Gemmatimonadaceae bacterium]
HTEAVMPASGHLLANGFHAGKTWLFDLTSPRAPKILTEFGDVGGFSHPHTYVRLANGNVLATFQYAADSSTPAAASSGPEHTGMNMTRESRTGALVEMDERGTLVRVGKARDTTIADRRIYPYSVLPLASIDRAVSTTTNMNPADTAATAEWVQFWRLSDLTLRKSIALPPGPRGDEQKFSGEPFLLPDGKNVYIHTFNCGLYLVRGVEQDTPTASFVHGFPGKDCGVPLLVGHYWLQTVPSMHALVAMDISDPEHPREVSSVSVGDDEQPHWVSIDASGTRVVLNSAGGGSGNRLFMISFDPKRGALTLDERFRDAGAARAGVRLSAKTWPHGFTGTAVPHGSVFSR